MALELNPTKSIIKRLGVEEKGMAQKFFTNSCYKHMDKYVPQRNGNLRTIVDIQNDMITYESNYAKYQYKGERRDGTHKVQNYTTPGTGPYWDKRMSSAEIKDVVKELEEYIGYIGG